MYVPCVGRNWTVCQTCHAVQRTGHDPGSQMKTVPSTIEELDRYTSEELLDFCAAAPDMRDVILRGLREMGARTRPKVQEFDRIVRESVPHACTACDGTGLVHTHHRHVGSLHPSAAHMCPTRVYYDLTGEIEFSERRSPKDIATFAVGTAMHELYQRIIFADPIFDGEAEVKAAFEPWGLIDGHADGLLTAPYRAVLELKSIYGDGFDKLRKPHPEHVLQAGIYARALNAPFICVIYGNKRDFSEIKQFWMTYPVKVVEKWQSQVMFPIMEAIGEGRFPSFPLPKDYTCSECGYKHGCKLYRRKTEIL